MEQIRKILTAFCAVLFFFSGVLALLFFNIESKAFTSTTYKRAFDEQNLYANTPTILASALYARIAEDPSVDPYLKALTVEDWTATITALLPPDEIKAITDSTLDSVFDYINGRTDAVTISLLPFKSHLVGPSGVEAVKQILKAQPDCTPDQLLQMGLGILGGNVALCNPPEELMGLVTPAIETQLQFLVVTFPDEIKLESGTQNGSSGDPRLALNRIRAAMKISLVFPFMFLFGITIFGVRSLMDWFKWWGCSFLITGITGFLIALIGSPMLEWLIERVMQTRGASLIPPGLLSAMMDAVSAVASQILLPVLIEGAVIASLGLVMVIIATVLKQRQA